MAHFEVFDDTHPPENTPILWHDGDTAPHPITGRPVLNLFVFQGNRPTFRLDDAEDGLQRGRFPGSVPTQQTDHLARIDLQANILEGVDRPVVDVDVRKLKKRLA